MLDGFTLGPWDMVSTGDGKRIIIGSGLVEGPNGYDVAEVYSDDCDYAEAYANACLISSAPELQEALRIFFTHYPMGINPYLDVAHRLARVALAKSTGVSHD